VFDITNVKSYEDAIYVWIKLAKEKTDNAIILLVGNKCDLSIKSL